MISVSDPTCTPSSGWDKPTEENAENIDNRCAVLALSRMAVHVLMEEKGVPDEACSRSAFKQRISRISVGVLLPARIGLRISKNTLVRFV